MDSVENDELEQPENEEKGEEEEWEDQDQEKLRTDDPSPGSSVEHHLYRNSGTFHAKLFQDMQKLKRRKAQLEEANKERRRLARSQLEQGIEVANFKIPDEFPCLFDLTNTGLGGAELKEHYRTALNRQREKKDRDTVLSMTKALSGLPMTGTFLPTLTTPDRASVCSLTLSEISSVSSMKKSKPFIHGDETDSQAASKSSAGQRGFDSVKESTHDASTARSVTRRTHLSTYGTEMFMLCDNKIRFAAPYHIKKRLTPPREKIPWLHERLQVSSVSVRYEIPMDIREFEHMSVKHYLCKYCKIPKERMATYLHVYKRHKSPKTHQMTLVELSRAVLDILRDSVTERSLKGFLNFLQLDRITGHVDIKIFAAIAATAERILYLSFVETSGRVAPPGQVRSFLESADFSNLKWKLDGIPISSELKILLFSLG